MELDVADDGVVEVLDTLILAGVHLSNVPASTRLWVTLRGSPSRRVSPRRHNSRAANV